MMRALHAEWTKLRTAPETGWLLLGCIALTVVVSATAGAAVTCSSPSCGLDPARIGMAGVILGQVAVVVLAVGAIGDEYASGMIHVTFTAIPNRVTVLASKAAVIACAVAAAGSVAVLGSVLLGQLILPAHGFNATNGYALLPLADAPTVRAAVGSVLYLALIALLSLGVGTVVRDSAVAVGIVLALLYGFPVVAQLVSDPEWQTHLQQIGPMTAGLAVQATIGLSSQPISPLAGLGVLAAWAAGALLVGGVLLRRRDA